MSAESQLAGLCQTITKNNEAHMTRILTADEIALCDQFQTFMRSLFVDGVTCVGVTAYASCGGFYGASIQDEYEAFSPERFGTVAENIQGALDAFAVVHPPEKTADEIKAYRIAKLREELAKLESA